VSSANFIIQFPGVTAFRSAVLVQHRLQAQYCSGRRRWLPKSLSCLDNVWREVTKLGEVNDVRKIAGILHNIKLAQHIKIVNRNFIYLTADSFVVLYKSMNVHI